MDQIFKNKTEQYLALFYFFTVVLSAFVCQKTYPLFWEIISLLRVPSLILLYLVISKEKNFIYFIALLLFLATHLLFKYKMPYWAGLSSLLFRFLTFLIVFKSFQNKNWVALFLASLPFLVLYISLIVFIADFLQNDLYFWLLNGFFTSLIGGMAIYNFIYESENKNFWLLFSAILFVFQIGFFFINHFYLTEKILIQITIILFGVSNFTFYKFVIVTEDKEESVLE